MKTKKVQFVVSVEVRGESHRNSLAREARFLLESANRQAQGAGWSVTRSDFKKVRTGAKTPKR